VYFNNSAENLFGYTGDDIGDLDLGDIFVEDVAELLKQAGATAGSQRQLQMPLTGSVKDGSQVAGDAIIRPLQGVGGGGYAIVFNPVKVDAPALPDDVVDSFRKSAQRMDAVEQSLNSLLELARTNPGVVAGAGGEAGPAERAGAGVDKTEVRRQAVNVMLAALACWEHDVGRGKLDLAEESGIWPVYIDKSTPTTRTLDKYLNIDSCPKNPRTQRVIDTAEFVLKQLGRRSTADRDRLQQALHDFRLLVSGIKPSAD
jgi:hypothetical protein